MTSLYDILIASGCGSAGAFIINRLYRKDLRRDQEEHQKLEAIMEKRISSVEIACQKQGAILVTIDNLAKAVSDLSVEVKKSIEINARQSEALRNLTGYVGNLREDIREVRKTLDAHICSDLNKNKKGPYHES